MAVLHKATPNCYLIDHLRFINNLYTSCELDDSEQVVLKFRDVFFEIKCPFQLDTQAYKNSVQLEKNEDLTLADAINNRRKRKRNRKDCLASEEKDEAAQEGKKIESELKVALGALLQSNCKVYFDDPPSSADVLANNAGARAASRMVDRNRLLEEICTSTRTQEYREIVLESNVSPCIDSLLQIVNCVVTYNATKPAVVSIGAKRYVMPPGATFLLSDVQNLHLLNNKKQQYDVILLDPPWQNKSVKRKKGYHTVREEDLESLPISALAAEGCLVIVWITNNVHQKSAVKERLFPSWGVEYCAEWHWLKLTKSGQTVIHMDCTQKKPYEHLLLGRVRENSSTKQLPEHLVFASVPSSIHSHKPPLKDLLEKYVDPNSRCLELFARSLLPGWTSWGNEVLKLQQMDYYQVLSLATEVDL